MAVSTSTLDTRLNARIMDAKRVLRVRREYHSGRMCSRPVSDDDDKLAPGICGCGTPDIDSDNDGRAQLPGRMSEQLI